MSSDLEIAAFIGLDWADQQHVIRLRVAGLATVETQLLDQKPETLRAWIGQLRQRFGGRPVALALEQSRGSLLYALMNVDFLLLYPVNPQNLAQYRKAFYPSGAKDDPQDALLLLEMLEKHRDRLRVWVPDDADTRCLRLLAENRRKLVNHRTALTNQLTSLLKESFPQALDWAGPLDSLRACDFLEHWPSLPRLQKTSTSRLRKFYRDHTRLDSQAILQRLDQIRQAQPLTSDSAVLAAAQLMIPALVRQLRCLIETTSSLVKLKEGFQQHDDYTLFHSFLEPAPPWDRACCRPLAPIATASNVLPRSKCSAGLLRSPNVAANPTGPFGVWPAPSSCARAFMSLPLSPFCSPPGRAFYYGLRSRGTSHHAAVRTLAFKWIRILFRCWKNRTPYDEQIYLASLRRRARLCLPHYRSNSRR